MVAHNTIAIAGAINPSSDRIAAAVVLEDGVVSIGPVLPADRASIFAWMNDTAAAKLDFAWRPTDYNAFASLIDRISVDAAQALFAIRKIGSPDIVGYVMLKNIQPVHRSAELTIRIGAETDRGQGIGRRAVILALDRAFRTLQLHRVHLETLTHNTRAIASYRAAGFKEEGCLREARFMDGEWCDVTIMAILRTDWANR